ncbi:MAG: restriction endonuclease subunit S [Paludibacteraceae bacterium]|nr:restriction endonuclease subunit S [Paludibacteraceae bacterium]
MKDSGIPWIGEIPEGWKVNMLSSLFDEHKQKNKDLSESNLLSLSYGKIVRKDINTKEGLLPESFEGYNIISNGDIVFRLTDLQNDKRSLRTGLCLESGIITSAYVTIRARQQLYSPYYHYLVHSYDVCKVFYGMGDGVRQGMNYSDLRRLLLITPPLAEQHLIATFLDKKCSEIDSLIELQEQMIEELKAYKQSIITEAVTKGLNPNVQMKDSGVEWIGDVPEEWEVKKLSKLLSFKGGFAFNSDDFINSGDNQVIRIGNVRNDLLRLEVSSVYISDDIAIQAQKSQLEKGQILFTMTGTKGKRDYFYTLLLKEEDFNGKKFFLNQRVGCFVPKNGVCANYYNYLLKDNHILDFIFLYETGTANQGNLGIESINKTILQYPPLAEQQAIADYLDKKCGEIDELITIKQQKIESLKEYKKSVIYEYVTGKREV